MAGKSNLVIITCGPKSLHQQWEKNHAADSNFDLALLIYDDTVYTDHNSLSAKYTQQSEGIKFKLFDKFLNDNPSVINEYEYFLLFDDDLLTTVDNLSEYFDIVKKYNFDLAQPALTKDSYYSHWPTLQQSGTLYHLTNYVEIMCPSFSQRFLKDVKSIFTEMEIGIGWGMEQYWFDFLENYNGISKYGGRVGVIDKIAVKHTKPAMSGPFYEKYDFGKEMNWLESKCDKAKWIWEGQKIISVENGFKTLSNNGEILYDILPNSAYCSVGTITSEQSVEDLDVLLNGNKDILNKFPYIVVAQNRVSTISDEVYEQSKQVWINHFPDVTILDIDVNRGHCFGAMDLDNAVVDFAKTLPIEYIWKSANDIYLTSNMLGNKFDKNTQFYYLQGIGQGGIENYKNVGEAIKNTYENITHMYPQTNFYIISKDVDYINNKEYVNECYDKCINTPGFTGKAWEYIQGFTNEDLLRECIKRNEFKYKHLLSYETYNNLVNFVVMYNVHDCSHKNVFLIKHGICHFHDIHSGVYEII
jgi:hypothetical protein